MTPRPRATSPDRDPADIPLTAWIREGTSIVLEAAYGVALWRAADAAKRAISAHGARIDAAKRAGRAMLGDDADQIILDDGRVIATLKTKTGTARIDVDRARADGIDLTPYTIRDPVRYLVWADSIGDPTHDTPGGHA